MEDFERYGDYNELEDGYYKKGRNIPMLVLKILTALICISVIAVIAFRLVLFNRYPAAVSNIYFNDTLKNFYSETDGNIGAKTQVLKAPYDNNKKASFFCDKLIVIDKIGQLQITVRYNSSNVADIAYSAGLSYELDDMDPSIFSFRLCACYGDIQMPGSVRIVEDDGDFYDVVYYDDMSEPIFESHMMYRYQKLIFDGVKFIENDTEAGPVWIRLEVFVKGQSADFPFAKIPIYENHETAAPFSEYKLSDEEIPE